MLLFLTNQKKNLPRKKTGRKLKINLPKNSNPHLPINSHQILTLLIVIPKDANIQEKTKIEESIGIKEKKIEVGKDPKEETKEVIKKAQEVKEDDLEIGKIEEKETNQVGNQKIDTGKETDKENESDHAEKTMKKIERKGDID